MTGIVAQKYLGLFCDSNLSGQVHAQRAKAKALAKCHTVSTIAKRLGEQAALLYAEKVVAPLAMSATGFIRTNPGVKPVLNTQNALRVEAAQCGAINDWWRDKAQVRTPALVREDKVLPWLAEWEKRVIAQGAKVRGTAGSLVEEVKRAK